jgi:hypothetical protein
MCGAGLESTAWLVLASAFRFGADRETMVMNSASRIVGSVDDLRASWILRTVICDSSGIVRLIHWSAMS